MWWPPYYPNLSSARLFVCLFACVFVRLFVCLLCFYVVIFNVFVFLIYSMLKWQNKIVIHFVEGHPSSFNLMTFILDKVSFLVFKCNNPTYNASCVTLYGKDAMTLVMVHAHCSVCPQLRINIFTYGIEYKLPKSCCKCFN